MQVGLWIVLTEGGGQAIVKRRLQAFDRSDDGDVWSVVVRGAWRERSGVIASPRYGTLAVHICHVPACTDSCT